MAHVAESGLGPTDRLVAAAMATFADAEGECFPSDKALAEITGLAERSHAAVRRRLITEGLLERDVYGHGRRNRSASSSMDPGRTTRAATTPRLPTRSRVRNTAPASAESSPRTWSTTRQFTRRSPRQAAPTTASGGTTTPRQPRPLRAPVARHRRDSEGPREVPKREVSTGRGTSAAATF